MNTNTEIVRSDSYILFLINFLPVVQLWDCLIYYLTSLPILQDCLHLAKYSSEMRHFISVITYFIFEH